MDSTILENRGIKLASNESIVPKLLCVGLVKYAEVASLFLDELYAEAGLMGWTRRIEVADSVLGILSLLDHTV